MWKRLAVPLVAALIGLGAGKALAFAVPVADPAAQVMSTAAQPAAWRPGYGAPQQRLLWKRRRVAGPSWHPRVQDFDRHHDSGFHARIYVNPGVYPRYWGGYYGGSLYRYNLPPFYYAPSPYRIQPRVVYSGHVEWCMANYRSYDPVSDTFVGYDGLQHACVSPYDY